jgi:hypothetical protein
MTHPTTGAQDEGESAAMAFARNAHSSGGGNLHRVATDERGRDNYKQDGMLHKVLRSVSRAKHGGGDRKND